MFLGSMKHFRALGRRKVEHSSSKLAETVGLKTFTKRPMYIIDVSSVLGTHRGWSEHVPFSFYDGAGFALAVIERRH
jgi:hypothetical protein